MKERPQIMGARKCAALFKFRDNGFAVGQILHFIPGGRMGLDRQDAAVNPERPDPVGRGIFQSGAERLGIGHAQFGQMIAARVRFQPARRRYRGSPEMDRRVTEDAAKSQSDHDAETMPFPVIELKPGCAGSASESVSEWRYGL